MYPDLNQDIKGRKIEEISLSDDKEILTIKAGGLQFRYGVGGDCCSSSWIEHLEVPDGIIGSEVIEVEEMDIDGDEAVQKAHCEKCKTSDCLRVYQVLIKTTKGVATLEFRNDSNGYYGGYLVKQ